MCVDAFYYENILSNSCWIWKITVLSSYRAVVTANVGEPYLHMLSLHFHFGGKEREEKESELGKVKIL